MKSSKLTRLALATVVAVTSATALAQEQLEVLHWWEGLCRNLKWWRG